MSWRNTATAVPAWALARGESNASPAFSTGANAFDMACIGHIQQGMWTHPRDHSIDYLSLDHWTRLAQLLERGLFDGLFLADVSYDDAGVMTYPHHGTTAPVAALAGYLDLGRQILAAATPPDLAAAHVSDDFDQLLWFELPQESYAP